MTEIEQLRAKCAELEASLAEIGKQEYVTCPYPCGWENLYSYIISRAAHVVRSIDSDEISEEVHKSIIDLIHNAKTLCEFGMKLSDPAARIAELEREVAELKQRHQWQPIETTPKDGTTFDIWVKSHKNESYGVRMTSVYYNNGVICGRKYPNPSFGEYATHWMPQPDAPAIDAVKGGVA